MKSKLFLIVGVIVFILFNIFTSIGFDTNMRLSLQNLKNAPYAQAESSTPPPVTYVNCWTNVKFALGSRVLMCGFGSCSYSENHVGITENGDGQCKSSDIVD
ncbi:MAG TPA: hypothetical protein PLK12_07375 [Prolixibacteraceae bacterium]|nr:hypothetical protein [Prolixibacteraceae bacterium]